eukprot:1143642-Pelagomonas_calceolata.AAC.1
MAAAAAAAAAAAVAADCGGTTSCLHSVLGYSKQTSRLKSNILSGCVALCCNKLASNSGASATDPCLLPSPLSSPLVAFRRGWTATLGCA